MHKYLHQNLLQNELNACSKLGLFVGGMWRLENDVSLGSINLSILSGCGDNLMETVCRDACSGHDVPKVCHYMKPL